MEKKRERENKKEKRKTKKEKSVKKKRKIKELKKENTKIKIDCVTYWALKESPLGQKKEHGA